MASFCHPAMAVTNWLDRYPHTVPSSDNSTLQQIPTLIPCLSPPGCQPMHAPPSPPPCHFPTQRRDLRTWPRPPRSRLPLLPPASPHTSTPVPGLGELSSTGLARGDPAHPGPAAFLVGVAPRPPLLPVDEQHLARPSRPQTPCGAGLRLSALGKGRQGWWQRAPQPEERRPRAQLRQPVALQRGGPGPG